MRILRIAVAAVFVAVAAAALIFAPDTVRITNALLLRPTHRKFPPPVP